MFCQKKKFWSEKLFDRFYLFEKKFQLKFFFWSKTWSKTFGNATFVQKILVEKLFVSKKLFVLKIFGPKKFLIIKGTVQNKKYNNLWKSPKGGEGSGPKSKKSTFQM